MRLKVVSDDFWIGAVVVSLAVGAMIRTAAGWLTFGLFLVVKSLSVERGSKP